MAHADSSRSTGQLQENVVFQLAMATQTDLPGSIDSAPGAHLALRPQGSAPQPKPCSAQPVCHHMVPTIQQEFDRLEHVSIRPDTRDQELMTELAGQ